MSFIKDMDLTCPNCESDDVSIEDWDYYEESLCRKMYCPHCDHVWREYYLITYNGYSDETGEYDFQGKKVD